MRSLQKTLSELQNSVQSLQQQSISNNNRNPSNNNAGSRQCSVPQCGKLKCYGCGSEHHQRNRCPLNKNSKPKVQNNDSQKEAEQHHTKHIASKSSGFYLPYKINSFPTDCLVNTGATLLILHVNAWETPSQKSTMSLNPSKWLYLQHLNQNK